MAGVAQSPDPPAASLEYRFSDGHRDIFRTLAQSMSFVGVSLVLLSLLGGAIFGLVTFAQGLMLDGCAVLLAALALILIGWWIMAAGRSFGALVRTQGRDVKRLMEALVELRRLFAFARVVLIVSTLLVVLVAAGVYWCMFVGQAGSRCLGVFG